MKKITVLFCACIVFFGCTSTPKVDVQAETDAIRNLEDQWSVALQTSNAEKILSFYAPEAVNMRSNKPILVGLEAIRNSIESNFADTTLLFKTYTGTVDVIEVSATGDLAYARGHDEITTKTKDGLVIDKGKWVDIWKKIDGQWKVTVSTASSDIPKAGQE
jgi:uncharacterized protein (TIGR02246 family)